MKRQLHLNLFINSRGHHEASWRHPNSSPLPLSDARYYVDCAQKAEAAKFDSIFLADILATPDDVDRAARCWLEPITALGALSMVTNRIGLIATASTTYSEPYNLARQFASIDHMSNGRAGWNIVTSFHQGAARNFGLSNRPNHTERYDRGDEFVGVCKALWDSWSDDTVVDDRAGGLYARKDRIRAVEHEGEHYSVAGSLNLPRSPPGPAGVDSGGLLRHRHELRGAPRRGGVHRTSHPRARAGLLPRPEAACHRPGTVAGSDPDSARPLTDDCRHRG